MSSLRWQEAETFGAKLSALGAALGATCGAEEFRESVKDRDGTGGDRGRPGETGGDRGRPGTWCFFVGL